MADETTDQRVQGPITAADGERLTIAVHEEVLEPRLREVETGRIRVHKRVETVPTELMVDVGHDDVSVERVAVDRAVDGVPEPWQEGDTLIIPVVEEVIVTETRLVVREEIRITRRRVTEQVPVQAELRKERIEFEEVAPEDRSTSP